MNKPIEYNYQINVHVDDVTDYIDEVLHESEKAEARKSGSGIKEDWESGITFTVHPSRKYFELLFIIIITCLLIESN